MEPKGSLPRSQKHATYPYPEPDQFSPCPPVHRTTLRSVLILSSPIRFGLPSAILSSGFRTKTLYASLRSPIRARCPGHLNLLELITQYLEGTTEHTASCYVVFSTSLFLGPSYSQLSSSIPLSIVEIIMFTIDKMFVNFCGRCFGLERTPGILIQYISFNKPFRADISILCRQFTGFKPCTNGNTPLSLLSIDSRMVSLKSCLCATESISRILGTVCIRFHQDH